MKICPYQIRKEHPTSPIPIIFFIIKIVWILELDQVPIISQPIIFVTYKFQNKYGTKNFLNCKDVSKNAPNIFWNFEGRVSTSFSDSLNYTNYYPKYSI